MQKIVKATYGTKNHYLDVTHILSYLVTNNDTIRISNNFFDDPDLGVRKRLFVRYDDGMCAFYDEGVVVRINLMNTYPLN